MINTTKWRSRLGPVARVCLAVVVGVVCGGVVIWLVGFNPLSAFRTMVMAAFGTSFGLSTSLRWAATLMLLGLSVALSFRAGMFNIGAQGQFYVGALLAVIGEMAFGGLPAVLAISLAILCGALGGALWAAIPGLLRAYVGVNEVVSTLMMNFIAIQMTNYLIRVPFRGSDSAGQVLATSAVPDKHRISMSLFSTPVPATIVFAVVVALAVWIYMKKTSWGYEDKVSGLNPRFAQYGGISMRATTVRVFLLSGALAGVAGALEVFGPVGRFVGGFDADLGFTAVVVALAGGNSGIGVLFAGLFFGGLAGAEQQLRLLTDLPQATILVIEGFITLFVTARFVVPRLRRRRDRGRSDRRPMSPSEGADTASTYRPDFVVEGVSHE